MESYNKEEHPNEKVWNKVSHSVPNAVSAKTLDARLKSLLKQLVCYLLGSVSVQPIKAARHCRSRLGVELQAH